MSSFPRAGDQASTESRGGICRHHKGWSLHRWSGMGTGIQVDTVDGIRKASGVLREAGNHSFT